jgi:hypothetical protein
LVHTVADNDEELHTKIQAIHQAASSTIPRARKLNRSWLARRTRMETDRSLEGEG